MKRKHLFRKKPPCYRSRMITGGLTAAFAVLLIATSNMLGPVEIRSQLPVAPTPTVLAGGPLICDKDAGPSSSVTSPSFKYESTTRVGSTWAGQPVGQSLLVAGSKQYVAYYGASRRLTIKMRVGQGAWTAKTLDTQVGWDSHNYVTMALDSKGNLHVAGNMHATKLNYYVTTTPGNVATLERIGTLANSKLESAVTYPQFLRNSAGGLFFKFRYGGSGSGVDFIYRFVAATKKWQLVTPGGILNGQGTSSAYSSSPVLGPDGYFHMVWMWRDTPDVSTNHSLSYAKTSDFIHWQNLQGVGLTMPMTKLSKTIVDPATVGSGLVNGIIGLGFDSAKHPIISYTRLDAAKGNQLFVVRGAAPGGWQRAQVTRWNGVFAVRGTGSLSFPISTGSVTAAGAGTLQFSYSCYGKGRNVVLEEKTLAVISDHPSTSPFSGSPMMPLLQQNAQLVTNRTATRSGSSIFFLQWRSMPINGDKPRAVIPPAEPLVILEYRAG